MRIAQLHFTSSPCIGGVEDLIDRQTDVIRSLGHTVRYIVGRGNAPDGVEMERFDPLLPPAQLARENGLPGRTDARVIALASRLRAALAGCDQCWVHNILTLDLHPVLTAAVARAMTEIPTIRWVVWAYDVSDGSAYARGFTDADRRAIRRALADAPIVTISKARRAEIARFFAVPPERVRVVSPPIAVAEWLGLGTSARVIVDHLALPAACPVVFVPAKILPHKNLGLAVRVAAALKRRSEGALMILSAASSPHEDQVSRDGAGALRGLARELGADDVVWLLPDLIGGTADRTTIRDLMLLSDVVLLPSTEEGYGMPLLEAAALRAPVLAADIPPFREAGGDAAEYFGLNDEPQAIAERIGAIATGATNRRRRVTLQSLQVFARQIANLVDTGIPDRAHRP